MPITEVDLGGYDCVRAMGEWLDGRTNAANINTIKKKD